MVHSAQAQMLVLELGQEIEARVVEMLADGRVILDIGGTLLEANAPGALQLGQRLRLRVDLLEREAKFTSLSLGVSPDLQLLNVTV
jgi:hypothetical protein